MLATARFGAVASFLMKNYFALYPWGFHTRFVCDSKAGCFYYLSVAKSHSNFATANKPIRRLQK
jgi:hypothetical protein